MITVWTGTPFHRSPELTPSDLGLIGIEHLNIVASALNLTGITPKNNCFPIFYCFLDEVRHFSIYPRIFFSELINLPSTQFFLILSVKYLLIYLYNLIYKSHSLTILIPDLYIFKYFICAVNNKIELKILIALKCCNFNEHLFLLHWNIVHNLFQWLSHFLSF